MVFLYISLKTLLIVKASLEWLKRLGNPDWGTAYDAPWGEIRTGDLFAAWVAHDLHHMRQLVELHYAFTLQMAGDYQTRYAGEW